MNNKNGQMLQIEMIFFGKFGTLIDKIKNMGTNLKHGINSGPIM